VLDLPSAQADGKTPPVTHLDLNTAADRARRRKLAARGAWSHLVALQPEDIRAVLLDMLTDLDDENIPNVAPAQAVAAADAHRGAETPTPTAPALPPGRGTSAAPSAVSAPTPSPYQAAPPAEEAATVEQDDDDGDASPANEHGRRRLTAMMMEVLEDARRPLRSTEILDHVRRRDPTISDNDVHKWLRRAHENRKVIRRGTKGQFKFSLRPTTPEPEKNGATPEPGALLATESKLYSDILTHLAAGPADYTAITMALFSVDHGRARQDVRNALYYLRDRRHAVRFREDGKWELAPKPEAA